MCTSFTLTAHGQTFFARTMDFAFLLDGEPIVMPRGYQWSLQLGDRSPIPMALLGRANS